MQLAPLNDGNIDVTVENIYEIVQDIVNDNNDTSDNGARSTAVQTAILKVVVSKNGSGTAIVEPAGRARERLAVLIASAQELSDRLV